MVFAGISSKPKPCEVVGVEEYADNEGVSGYIHGPLPEPADVKNDDFVILASRVHLTVLQY